VTLEEESMHDDESWPHDSNSDKGCFECLTDAIADIQALRSRLEKLAEEDLYVSWTKADYPEPTFEDYVARRLREVLEGK